VLVVERDSQVAYEFDYRYKTLFSKHDVVVCILLTIAKSHVLHVGNVVVITMFSYFTLM